MDPKSTQICIIGLGYIGLPTAAILATIAQQGRFPEAVEQFEAAVEIDPKLIQALGNLMAAYANLGRRDEAIAAAEKAQQLAQANGDTSLEEQITTFLTHLQSQSPDSPAAADSDTKH